MNHKAGTNRVREGMTAIVGGSFLMGSEEFYPEERPVREVSVGPFSIDVHPVTVGEFRRFVVDTGYQTVAERAPARLDYPTADSSLLVPGSAVFQQTEFPVDLDSLSWWRYVHGASWHEPEGPGSYTPDLEDHPVTHVSYDDAEAYARWAGKALPTEVEWERAARGSLVGARFAWGDEESPNGQRLANTWQGEFPWQNICSDGYPRTSPVGSFPPNDFGVFDMIGNVWEWTTTSFTHRNLDTNSSACCAPHPAPPSFSARVVKGGSHLCAPNYCCRYRPAARQGQTIDTSTSHVGFRCVVRR
jgi:sulfatase modifying factor 1